MYIIGRPQAMPPYTSHRIVHIWGKEEYVGLNLKSCSRNWSWRRNPGVGFGVGVETTGVGFKVDIQGTWRRWS